MEELEVIVVVECCNKTEFKDKCNALVEEGYELVSANAGVVDNSPIYMAIFHLGDDGGEDDFDDFD